MDIQRIQQSISDLGLSSAGLCHIAGWLDTGHPALNAAFGHPDKGMPLGRLVGIVGGEGYGKSSLLYWLGGKMQSQGGFVFIADEEGSLQGEWAGKLGLNVEENFLPITLGFKEVKKGKKTELEPEGLEDLFSKCEAAILTMRESFPDTPALILWDSVAATLTQKELEGDYEDESIALGARVLSRGMRKLHKIMIGSRISMVYVNQYRTRIASYGTPGNTMPGGRALNYYSSIKVQVARTAKRDGHVIVQVKNEKNKVSAPFRMCNFRISFEEGILDIK